MVPTLAALVPILLPGLAVLALPLTDISAGDGDEEAIRQAALD